MFFFCFGLFFFCSLVSKSVYGVKHIAAIENVILANPDVHFDSELMSALVTKLSKRLHRNKEVQLKFRRFQMFLQKQVNVEFDKFSGPIVFFPTFNYEVPRKQVPMPDYTEVEGLVPHTLTTEAPTCFGWRPLWRAIVYDTCGFNRRERPVLVLGGRLNIPGTMDGVFY